MQKKKKKKNDEEEVKSAKPTQHNLGAKTKHLYEAFYM